MAPHDRFAELVSAGDSAGAIQFLAHALPRYECVAWGARCLLEHGGADRLDPLMVASLRWLDQPGDQLRRDAGALASATTKASPARLLAHAVLMSGGSIAPADLPPVNPPAATCAALVAGAVLTGAYRTPDPDAALRASLAAGDTIARGE